MFASRCYCTTYGVFCDFRVSFVLRGNVVNYRPPCKVMYLYLFLLRKIITMKIEKAKSYLDRYQGGEIWALITIAVTEGPCGTSVKIEPPPTFNPILMYAWLQLLEVDLKVNRDQLLSRVPPEKKEWFLSEVKRFMSITLEENLKRHMLSLLEEEAAHA